jgi:hypothetical protein
MARSSIIERAACCRRRGRGQLHYNFFFGAERDYYRGQDPHQAGQAGVKEFDQE